MAESDVAKMRKINLHLTNALSKMLRNSVVNGIEDYSIELKPDSKTGRLVVLFGVNNI